MNLLSVLARARTSERGLQSAAILEFNCVPDFSRARRTFGRCCGLKSALRPVVIFRCAFVALAISAVSYNAAGQARYNRRYQEPEWLTFHLSEVSAGVYAEGVYESDNFQKAGISVSHQNIFIGPSIGFSAEGTVYHPNFLRYFINTEGAFGWNQDKVVSTTTTTRNEFEYLGNFSATISLLENKPYHASAFVNYAHTYRDNDFFTRVTVDGLRYGARASWQLGDFSLGADYVHTSETSTSPYLENETSTSVAYINGTPVFYVTTNQVRLNQKSTTDQDTANFSARHQRAAGTTAFNYNLTRYTHLDGNTVGDGTDHAISLGDSERFGEEELNKLNANASYYHRNTTEEVSDQITAFAGLTLEHTPNLSSAYSVDYDHFETGSYHSDSYSGTASISHQLYESLGSTLFVRGTDYESSDTGSSGYTRRFGGGFTENYNKHVFENHRLRLKNTFFVEHTDQKSIGTILDERHTFLEANPEANSFILTQQRVISSTIVITDQGKTRQYIAGLDYELIPFGSQTEIHRLAGSSIPDAVSASYECEPTPPGSYETFGEAAEIRLELWKNLLAFYGRANLSLNNAPTNLMVQEVSDYTVGAEASWKALHAGAEYDLYYSTESNYRAARLFQSIAWHPRESSMLSLDATETWISYIDSNRQEDDYRVITRYHDQLTPHLALGVDAGVAYRRGQGVDQLLGTFRPTIRYVVGKTTIEATYDYEYDLYLHSQENQTHRFTLRYKRVF